MDTVKDAAQESFLTRTPKKKIEKGTKRAMIFYNLGGKFMCISWHLNEYSIELSKKHTIWAESNITIISTELQSSQ